VRGCRRTSRWCRRSGQAWCYGRAAVLVVVTAAALVVTAAALVLPAIHAVTHAAVAEGPLGVVTADAAEEERGRWDQGSGATLRGMRKPAADLEVRDG
jgi:hypothetical protein